MSSIECVSVVVRHRGAARNAVDDVSFSVRSGGWLGLIGPNGAGKSSLLQAIVGVNAYRGEVLVDGISLEHRARQRRAGLVAYVPQDPIIPVEMTGFDYVLLGRSPYVGYFASETASDREMVADVLAQLDLGDFANRPMGTLSGGERQRLVVARALATEASVLLMDEPTSALDIGHQQQTLELVAALRRDHGLTVIAAMHDLTLAGMYSDEMMLMHEGVNVAAGSVDEVLTTELLAEFYGVRVTVQRGVDGGLIVVPQRDI